MSLTVNATLTPPVNASNPLANSSSSNAKPPKKSKNLPIHLLAGGFAGCCEAITCHPLDTIKVRLQLRGERLAKGAQTNGNIAGQALKVIRIIVMEYMTDSAC